MPRSLLAVRAIASGVALASVLVGGRPAAAGQTPADTGVQTPSIFAPVSTPGSTILDLAGLVLAICAVIFVVVAGLLAYSVVRFRGRRDELVEPPQVYGSPQIELAWTVVPLLTVVIFGLATGRYIFAIEGRQPGEGAVEASIVGHQWWWEIRYPKLGVVTANELHLPVSDPASATPTFLTLESADVIHSFWVPQLAGKLDLIPNKTNRLWLDPHETGVYVGQCAEFCGVQHAGMLLRVIVHPKAEFEAWVADQQKPAVNDPAVDAGRTRFLSAACIGCHAIRGTMANGRVGPDLTHFGSRATLAAGIAPNTPDELRRWVHNPASLKPGALMPALPLSPAELDQVVAYLLSLR